MITYTPNWYRMSMAAGYPCVYCPDHPRAWSTGYIHAHVVVAESKIGRLLEKQEIVHHVDENKFNFEPSNLEVKRDRKEHKQYHLQPKTFVFGSCDFCHKEFSRRKGGENSLKFCSQSCSGKSSRKKQIELGINCKRALRSMERIMVF